MAESEFTLIRMQIQTKVFKNKKPDNFLTFWNLKILRRIQKNPLSSIAIFEFFKEE